jgi:hypothetical protein
MILTAEQRQKLQQPHPGNPLLEYDIETKNYNKTVD